MLVFGETREGDGVGVYEPGNGTVALFFCEPGEEFFVGGGEEEGECLEGFADKVWGKDVSVRSKLVCDFYL